MKPNKRTALIAMIFSSLLVLSACNDEPDTLSEKVEDVTTDAGNAVEDAATETGNTLEDITTDTGNAVEDACEEVKEGVNAEDSDC